MIANLEIKARTRNLDLAIADYEIKFKTEPVLLMSSATALSLPSVDIPTIDEGNLPEGRIGKYVCYKIFIDDDYKFGEVDVR